MVGYYALLILVTLGLVLWQGGGLQAIGLVLLGLGPFFLLARWLQKTGWFD